MPAHRHRASVFARSGLTGHSAQCEQRDECSEAFHGSLQIVASVLGSLSALLANVWRLQVWKREGLEAVSYPG
jgi:hypothetical protein